VTLRTRAHSQRTSGGMRMTVVGVGVRFSAAEGAATDAGEHAGAVTDSSIRRARALRIRR
jgi:hypothetical protein